MANPLSIKIKGNALKGLLDTTNPEVNKMFRKSLLASTLLVQNDAKKNAPFKRGNLRRSITSKVTKFEAKVGTDVIYAKIQEFGGVIRPKKGQYLRFPIKGQWVTVKSVKIPKYRGKGYLTPALQNNKKKITDIFSKAINKLIA